MTSKNNSYPVEVFAGSAVQANLIKSLLEDAEVSAYLKDEFTGVLAPWHSSPGGVGAVKVFVSSVDFEKAKMVVAEFKNSLNND
jgi:hypothetical protein